MNSIAYYKLEHDIEGTALTAVAHIASPPPFNERWTVTEITEDEYKRINGLDNRLCKECGGVFEPKTTKHVFCCNRCFMNHYGI